MRLPKPTNRESKELLQKMVNRLALAPRIVCRADTGHTCIFCGQAILPNDTYRNRGFAARAHDLCFQSMSDELKGDR